MIPCKENKCLKYPVCKHKVAIKCDDLREYYKKLESNIFSKIISAIIDVESAEAHESKVRKKINQTLPKLRIIS